MGQGTLIQSRHLKAIYISPSISKPTRDLVFILLFFALPAAPHPLKISIFVSKVDMVSVAYRQWIQRPYILDSKGNRF